MHNFPYKYKKNYAMKRFNTEENKVFPERIEKFNFRKNKLDMINGNKSIEKDKE